MNAEEESTVVRNAKFLGKGNRHKKKEQGRKRREGENRERSCI